MTSSFDFASGGAVRLPSFGVVTATGADAASFLHGQLTQAVQGLMPGQARLAGYCSPKGRLLATLVLSPLAPERLALVLSADLLAPTLKRLKMFVMRARCQLEDASAAWQVWGMAGPGAAQWLGDEATQAAPWRSKPAAGQAESLWIRLPDGGSQPRFLWLAPEGATAPPLPALPQPLWEWLEVRSGIARVVAATADHFVPQMVNLELVGGVDFQKGCYPGQEVVARSQYRGTLKRRMVLMRSTAVQPPGTEIYHPAEPHQPAGEVVLSAPAPDGHASALVEVKLALLHETGTDGTLKFVAGGADLTLDELPYPLPLESP
jgi:folate-binding protein YgfZ